MYKLELTKDELIFLRLNLHRIDVNEAEKKLINELYEKLGNVKPHYVSITKKRATKKATEVRSDKAKEKINNAINLLHLENKLITHYSIAQISGVSYNTVKKHIPDIDKIGKL
ncbi:hypothetical protein [Aliarcobacter butzleri]|uniref:hypothetical protein n=1 Tax=Aliarcobacter butzleri TaxID=28197 RepID=UPI0021B28C2A|nr:hypothetical protein [Aliarcobacter butzleri]MCT7600425.1 hypothetical protein [Aliarcobacter butzleri]